MIRQSLLFRKAANQEQSTDVLGKMQGILTIETEMTEMYDLYLQRDKHYFANISQIWLNETWGSVNQLVTQ